MNKTLAWLITLFLVPLHLASAQQLTKVPHIGVLAAASRAFMLPRIDALQKGFRDLGYIEGKTIILEYRYADGKLDALPALASELIQLNVNVILTSATPATLATKNATTTIPIVFVSVSDAVDAGLVTSVAKPGGNITG